MIETHEIETAQAQWSQALIHMGELSSTHPDKLRHIATQLLSQLYDFEIGLSFKPTLAGYPHHFRSDLAGTLSYFIGAKLAGSTISADQGFALKPWSKVEFTEATQIQLAECTITSGIYAFYAATAPSHPTTVEYTFVYHRTPTQPAVKIIAHHSSLPYHHSSS